MLIIRLQRVGKKNEPTFRVVLTDSKNGPKSGKFLEVLGSYDARDKNVTKIDGEKILEWISKGAQVSDTVNNLLINQKIIEGKKINVLPKKSPIVDEEALAKEKEAKEAEDTAKKQAEEVDKATVEVDATPKDIEATVEGEKPVEEVVAQAEEQKQIEEEKKEA